MRRIVHLSDLHFGRTSPGVREVLGKAIAGAIPDLVAISGDLTQRARTEEFRQAREFLDSLPYPQIVVPGNHDIPLYNVYGRAFRSLDKYRRHIGNDLEPFYCDDLIAVAGVNTARSLAFKGGRINRRQVARVCERMLQAGNSHVRMLVAHHPFDLPANFSRGGTVGRAREALKELTRCNIDVLLSGHFHVAHTADPAVRRVIAGHSALIVQAGTALSSRTRGELNSFNVLCVNPQTIRIDTHFWRTDSLSFEVSTSVEFRRARQGWVRKSGSQAELRAESAGSSGN